MSTPPTFAFRVPTDQLQRLRTLARLEGESAGSVLRRALRTELDRLTVLRLAAQASRKEDVA